MPGESAALPIPKGGDHVTTNAASAVQSTARRRDQEVPLWRLYLLRAVPLLALPWGLGLVSAALSSGPTDRGMVDSLLIGLWLMTLLAFRYPLQMLPIFLFEFTWKTVWLLMFGLPQLLSGTGSSRLGEDIWSIGAFPFVMAAVIPWGYVWRHYVVEPSERWR